MAPATRRLTLPAICRRVRRSGFAIGLLLLSIIFYPILAFGSAQYAPPSRA